MDPRSPVSAGAISSPPRTCRTLPSARSDTTPLATDSSFALTPSGNCACLASPARSSPSSRLAALVCGDLSPPPPPPCLSSSPLPLLMSRLSPPPPSPPSPLFASLMARSRSSTARVAVSSRRHRRRALPGRPLPMSPHVSSLLPEERSTAAVAVAWGSACGLASTASASCVCQALSRARRRRSRSRPSMRRFRHSRRRCGWGVGELGSGGEEGGGLV